MNIKLTLLTAACALALSACGDNSPPPAAPDTAADAPSTAQPAAPADTSAAQTPPAADATPAAASSAPAAGSTAAVINDCATEIEGNDAMQFNVKSIAIPSSCTDFTITLKHVGKMPVAAMGHNVVVTTAADMQAVAADGMAAGIDADYVKPDDDRVIAQTEMIGGGETTSTSFSVSEIQAGTEYKFFCSFPGHAALMVGTVTIE